MRRCGKARGGGLRCAVRTIAEPDAPIRAEYKAIGYRLGKTEPFMMHRMKAIPKIPAPLPIERVATAELAELLGKANQRRPLSPEQFAPDSPRQTYVALDDGKAVGWVTSIAVDDSAWINGMHVLPSHRRRGIGKSLLAHMLAESRRRGRKRSFLLSTHTGACSTRTSATR